MNDTNRPNLSLGARTEIADELYEMDRDLWAELRPMLMPEGISEKTRVSGPRPPKLDAKFYLILSNFSREAYHRESSRYPQYPPNPNFRTWLLNLAQRVEDHTIAVVQDIEASDSEKSFAYHGVIEDEMRKAIRKALLVEMERHHQFKPAPPPLKPPIPPHIQRQLAASGVDIASASPLLLMAATAARRAQQGEEIKANAASQRHPRRTFVEPILEEKGWSILDWANEADVAHATAMDYLQNKTKPYRSTRLKLAKALGIAVDRLPK